MAVIGPDPADENRFALRLKAVMKERKFTHRGLAEALGTSKQSVTNWTQGRGEPNLKNLRGLAHVLDVAPAFLLDDSPAAADTKRGEETVELLRGLTEIPIRAALDSLDQSGPSLLDLLSRAERHLRELDDAG